LYRAWKQYGFILIVVTVRNYPHHAPQEKQSWVTEIARAAFASAGMDFGYPGFIARLLEGGEFLLILDGLNEAGQEAECVRYAAVTPQVKLLVTSQTAPPKGDYFLLYKLPGPTEEFIGQLLGAMMGDVQAAEVVRALPSTLYQDIQSGYDVQLIAEFALNRSTGDSYTRCSRYVEITRLHGLPSVPMSCGLI
jgi:hypothetical protein